MALADRAACLPFPEDRGFALVGDADGRHVGGSDPGPGQRLSGRFHLRGPDRLRLVFDVAGTGEQLRELLLRERDDNAGAVEDDGTARRGALIEGKDEAAHDTSTDAGG